jgi:hypothetical protein
MKCFSKMVFAGYVLTAAAAGLHGQDAPVAVPAGRRASDHINDDLPRWVRVNGEYRVRFEGIDGIGFRSASDAFLLSRIRINASLIPLSWLRAGIQAQDAQVMARNGGPDGAPFEDTFDVRQAYVELGNPEITTFGMRMGRQELAFGEQRLVGHAGWLNTARSFDAVRATYRNSFVRIDAFAAAVVDVREGEFNKRTDGNNVHGAYAVLNTLVPRASVEPYVFWRLSRRVRSEAGTLDKLDFHTVGLRWVGRLPAGFDYNMDVAAQIGSLGPDDVQAWAGHWLAGYTIAAKYTPRVIAEYNFATGDDDPADGRREAFDHLYATAHDKYGLADQVGWKNVHHIRTGAELKPTPKLALSGSYHSWWLASARDGLYNAGGTLLARAGDGSAGRHVGQEADIQAVYSINAQIQISGGYARIFPGTFLQQTTPGNSHNFSYAMISHLF